MYRCRIGVDLEPLVITITGGAWAEQTRAMARPAKTKFVCCPLIQANDFLFEPHLASMCQVAAAPTL
jgi:hypothetical protein